MTKSITVNNCACISKANISIKENCINIKFGQNGTGKSSIAKLFEYQIKDDVSELIKLKPFGLGDSIIPIAENLNYNSVAVFNDKYVNQFNFKKQSENSYSVFLKTPEIENLETEIDSELNVFKDIFSESFQDILKMLSETLDELECKNEKIKISGGLKKFVSGDGAGFEKHSEFKKYESYYKQSSYSNILKWAKWKHDGRKLHNQSGNCPYCGTRLTSTFSEENTKFEKIFNTAAIKKADMMLNVIRNFHERKIISDKTYNLIKKYAGDSERALEFTSLITTLIGEANYLYSKLELISDFFAKSISFDEIKELLNNINILTIDYKISLKSYLRTTTLRNKIKKINDSISKLYAKSDILVKKYADYNDKVNQIICENSELMNTFLFNAGFPYYFEINQLGPVKSKCLLKPRTIDVNIEDIENYLSWGEKNAFALIVFLFTVVNSNPELIILDDPVTSFDKNKKFVVNEKLFLSESMYSFRNRTVLLFTHDLQPVIDYVKVYDLDYVNAAYLKNDGGILKEKTIGSGDLISFYTFLKQNYENQSLPFPYRIVCLRRFLELVDKKKYENEWNYLSSLIHGYYPPKKLDSKRNLDSYDEAEINQLNSTIKQYIDCFENYENSIELLNINSLIKELRNPTKNKYIYNVYLRLLIEKDSRIREIMKKKYSSFLKVLDETHHIEDDYLFQLNPNQFYNLPSNFEKNLAEFSKDIEIRNIINEISQKNLR